MKYVGRLITGKGILTTDAVEARDLVDALEEIMRLLYSETQTVADPITGEESEFDLYRSGGKIFKGIPGAILAVWWDESSATLEVFPEDSIYDTT